MVLSEFFADLVGFVVVAHAEDVAEFMGESEMLIYSIFQGFYYN